MPSDHDLPHATGSDKVMPLDRMGVDELHAHIAALRAEIARAETEIARKEGLRNAADSVFRRP